MSKLFGSLTTDGLEETEDRIGGFQPLDTDIYTGKVKIAYAGQSAGGAQNVTVIVDVNGREYRETVYVTDRNGKNYYLNKNDPKKKVPLPGFTTIDDLCLVTTGVPLAEQPTEEKIVKVYDPEAGGEVNKAVPMLTNLLGQEVSLGIVRQLENKSKKNASGVYEEVPETRETNFIDKVFHTETRMTVAEARQGKEGPEFWDAWSERNKGQIRDRRKIKDGESAGTSGRPGAVRSGPPMAGTGPKGGSLFGKK